MSSRPVPALERQDGLTVIELAVTILVVAVGLLAVIQAIVQSGRLTHSSQRREQAIAYGQSQLEQIRALPFASIALSSAPVHEPDGNSATDVNPRTPNHYVSESSPRCFAIKSNYADKTPAPGEACETLVLGGGVDPGPSGFDVNGTTGKAYRYVTAAPTGCYTVPVSICLDSTGAHLRRVIVVVLLDRIADIRSPRPIYVSSLVSDPRTAPAGIGP